MCLNDMKKEGSLCSFRNLILKTTPSSIARGADMSLTAAAGGFLLLLTVSVARGEEDWGVTYTPTQICALKGSAVDIHCTYSYPRMNDEHTDEHTEVLTTFWFTKERNDEPVDLETDSGYAGRVESQCERNNCTLTIRDVRRSDSAVYKFRFETNQRRGKFSGSPGVTLTVTDLQVKVSRSSARLVLTCRSSCDVADHPSYVWYNNGQKMEEDVSTYRVSVNVNDSFSCAVKGHEEYRSTPVYRPNLPSVSVSPSEIVEGSSVTLTCSSDSNPAAKYTWYKKYGRRALSEKTQFVFTSIKSSDSGQYYCTAENELGSRTSKDEGHFTFINVKYRPNLPSVSVSPSEIVEGSSVTLTCSSDANPAAKYTWYKSDTHLKSIHEEPQFVFRSITSSDSGQYYCEAGNKLGKNRSESVSIDVKYPPNLPSVSVSPSEIVEGSSVTLTCSSDANPAADYTWYKENEESPKASGQIFTITDIRAEHSGNYYCEAQNSVGRHNNTLHLTVDPAISEEWKSITVATVPAGLLAIILISVLVWIIIKSSSKQRSEPEEGAHDGGQIQPAEQQDDLSYATVYFSKHQSDAVHANTGPAQPLTYKEEIKGQEIVDYAAVTFNQAEPAAMKLQRIRPHCTAQSTNTAERVQGQNNWGVNYPATQMCAVNGSTVDMHCTYSYPLNDNGIDTTVTDRFWLIEGTVDLKTQPKYAGRAEYICDNRKCTLRIRDLTESDSAVYKFRFITNQAGGSYTGQPGVTLTVTALQIQVTRVTDHQSYREAELTCQSRCRQISYAWFKNGQNVFVESPSYVSQFYPGDNVSCALKGQEDYRSPSLYPPNLPSVSVSPSEIVEGSSVTLTCSSDANPAANYTWYKENGLRLLSENTQFVFTSINSSDSGQYNCTAENQLGTSSEYIFINVKYRPNLPSVSVSPSEIVEGSSVTLTCSSDANPAANYTWYKENGLRLLSENTQFVFTSIKSSDSGQYNCTAENQLGTSSEYIFINVKYPPRLPSVSVSPSEIVEGSSVTLTCSSDANPAAKYTWYKSDTHLKSIHEEPQFVFRSIKSSDSGQYYCEAGNKLGTSRSESVSIDVKYRPNLPSVSVSPSEIVEGSSVTLTCSSDANPAANYTWYKSDTHLKSIHEEPQFVFRSIKSSDSGQYYCEAGNKLGTSRSESVSIDVKYRPNLPSVSVSPSEIVEGSSVTLTCSSDANPAANYTWYKENEESPKASGQIFTITDIRAEHSGNYYCEVQNSVGRHNNTLHLTVDPGAEKSAAAAVTAAVLLVLLLLFIFSWIRKKNGTRRSPDPEETPDNREQFVCDQEQPEEQENLHYATVTFSNKPTDPVYSNIRGAQPGHMEEQELTEYSVVRFNSGCSALRTLIQHISFNMGSTVIVPLSLSGTQER
ncbi:B-cell receptor CD22-like [Anabas testudineus]|uniref:B-cell receptor CD22-like n=1 Tax=Anabas testudineus TaxID=64144 RepID=UPI000E465F65|nr:B-cell receptor CD22-like [Anabas testudineus]